MVVISKKNLRGITAETLFGLDRHAIFLLSWGPVYKEGGSRLALSLCKREGGKCDPPASDLLALHALVVPLSLPFGRLPRRLLINRPQVSKIQIKLSVMSPTASALGKWCGLERLQFYQIGLPWPLRSSLLTFQNLRVAVPTPRTKNGNVPFFLGEWVQLRIGHGNLC